MDSPSVRSSDAQRGVRRANTLSALALAVSASVVVMGASKQNQEITPLVKTQNLQVCDADGVPRFFVGTGVAGNFQLRLMSADGKTAAMLAFTDQGDLGCTLGPDGAPTLWAISSRDELRVALGQPGNPALGRRVEFVLRQRGDKHLSPVMSLVDGNDKARLSLGLLPEGSSVLGIANDTTETTAILGDVEGLRRNASELGNDDRTEQRP